MKQTEILTYATHVNGWFPLPSRCMSCMSQNFRLFHVLNISVRNFRIFLFMYPGSLTADCAGRRGRRPGCGRRLARRSRHPVYRWEQLRHPGWNSVESARWEPVQFPVGRDRGSDVISDSYPSVCGSGLMLICHAAILCQV